MSTPNSPIYTDNLIPIGSRVEDIKSGGGAGTAVGTYVLDNINLDRPGNVVERTNEIGEQNGWALIRKAETGTATIQIATATTPWPQRGHWFKDQFDGSTAGAVEQWVITGLSQPFEKEGYWKANCQIRKSANPPTS